MLRVKSRSDIDWHQLNPRNAPEMLTAKELEVILKISVKTIYSYVQRGLIPYVRIQSNVRFPKQAVVQWIEDQSYLPGIAHGRDPRRP